MEEIDPGRIRVARGSARPNIRTSSIATIENRSDGVAVITLDDHAETHNTITPALGGELGDALDHVFSDPRARAVVLRSGKKDSFLVGANIDFVRRIRFASDAEEAAREIAKRFARLTGTGTKPVVAWVHGPALGGGFELALACTASVASDDPKTLFGLPEVKLGLVPAANGLFRIAERAGLRVALDLGVTGRSLDPREARRLGLVDLVVPASAGLERAARLALRLADDPAYAATLARRRRAAQGIAAAAGRVFLERNVVGRHVLFRRARAATLEKTRGHYPAVERVVDLLARFGSRGFRSAADLEASVFGDLVVSETAHRLIDLFFAQTALKKDSGLARGETASPRSVERVAVLGAGLRGVGIALASAEAGLDVQLKDTDEAAVRRALRYVEQQLAERRRRGEITPLQRDTLSARLHGAIDYAALRDADLVFEAVFEDLALKHAVLRNLEKALRDTCIIASNTASISIAQIAEASARPEMIVGMRYLGPAHGMRLMEVVRTKHADPRAIATAVAIGRKQGRTVIVVRDAPAFYATRILAPYFNEAIHVLAEGASVEAVDRALVDWGFPIGPLQSMDEMGIDGVADVAEVVETAFGQRARLPGPLAALRADDRRGTRNARGFYLHGSAASRTRTVDATVYEVLGVRPSPRGPSADEIALRCSLAMVNEALRCHGDDVLRSARDGDVGAIAGAGFPPFRGGPFRYVDVLGPAEVLRRTRSLEQRFGDRFEPAPLLVEMARASRRFYG